MNNTEQPFTVRYSFVFPDFATRNKNTYVSLNLDRYLHQTTLNDNRDIPVESEMTLEYRFYCKMRVPEGISDYETTG